eukprot:6213000-Pleurochrysis_carterae.AAC.1
MSRDVPSRWRSRDHACGTFGEGDAGGGRERSVAATAGKNHHLASARHRWPANFVAYSDYKSDWA